MQHSQPPTTYPCLEPISPVHALPSNFFKLCVNIIFPPQPRSSVAHHFSTVKCRCNERQYNEMFRIAKLFLGPCPFPYLMCVKTFHFNKFRTFSITN